MIYLGGDQFAPTDSSQGMDTLIALMEHPDLASAANSFKSIPERKISVSQTSSLQGLRNSKLIYVFQREFATVDPSLVELVGTDEATTCIGIIIRNRRSGIVVDFGLSQMLSLVTDNNSDDLLDVHMIGGFDDISSQVWPIPCVAFDITRNVAY
ncbi:hypothetical protein ACJIZ3_007634 [Penstemon smallii]|uniref:Uncharacterized protein n=1 Tax=Penstemon smallii TaxID=265156 RepID=A0ABD3T8H6_9LAMI